MSRDSQSDSGRAGDTPPSRESFMVDIPLRAGTIADFKEEDPLRTVATGNDHAGITTEAHRRARRMRRNPSAPTG